MKATLTKAALSHLKRYARIALSKHHPTVIGIAGSVGKTSTRNALEAILKDHFPTRSVGNSETGVPLGILGMKPEDYSKKDWITMLAKAPFQTNFLKGTKYLIVEMGIDDPYPPKNMSYLLEIVKPDIAISLNVSATHTEQFEKVLTEDQTQLSPEERRNILIKKIAEEDTKIITRSGAKTTIYNADDPTIAAEVETYSKTNSGTVLLSFGNKSTNAVAYGVYRVSLDGSSYTFYAKQKDIREEVTIHLPHHVLPLAYREVFAASILTALQAGLTLKQITTSLEKNLELPKGRASIFQGINNSHIIDSSYNASLAATITLLDLVDTLKKETGRPVVFVWGDMRELGHEAELEHADVAKHAIGIVDYLYLVGPLTRRHALPILQVHDDSFKELRWFDSSIRVGEFLKENLPKDAIVLVKGSQNTIYLEDAITYILKDKRDEENLCRQGEYWKQIKKR